MEQYPIQLSAEFVVGSEVDTAFRSGDVDSEEEVVAL